MKILPVDKIEDGMVVARTLYDEEGRVLLREGARLQRGYVQLLLRHGFAFIYIKEPGIDDEIVVEEPVAEKTRTRAMRAIGSVVQSIREDADFTPAEVQNVTSQIVDDVLSRRELVHSLMDLQTHDTYTYTHSVNVCVLSVLVGMRLNFPRWELKTLALGAFLHDIGKLFVEQEVLQKPDKLTPEEFARVQEHPRRGFDLLRKKWEISTLAAHVALQHHERLDGSGYPRGLSGDKIHRYARIAAVCDFFDAVTSNRVYRGAMFPDQAAEILLASKTKYDQQVVQLLLESVALYPVGSIVRLSNGEVCRVLKVTRSDLTLCRWAGVNKDEVFTLKERSHLRIVERIA